MRRGEIAGLRWGDWNARLHQLSISRTRQALAGRSTKIRTSRRCLELDVNTEHVLECWRDRQRNDGHHIGTRDSMFTNTGGEPLHPESISLTTGLAPNPKSPVRRGDSSLPASRSPADATTLDRLAAGFSGKASNGTTRHSPDSLRRRSCAHHTTRSSASPSRGSLVSSLRQLKHSATRGVASRIGEFIARGASLGRPPDHRKNVLGQEIGRDGK